MPLRTRRNNWSHIRLRTESNNNLLIYAVSIKMRHHSTLTHRHLLLMSLTDYANLPYCTNQETFENVPYLSKPALAFFSPVLWPSAASYPKSYSLALTKHSPPCTHFTKPHSRCKLQCRRIRVVSHTAISVIFPSFHFVVNPFFLQGRLYPPSLWRPSWPITIALPFRGHGILGSNPSEDFSSTISMHCVLHNLNALTLLGLFREVWTEPSSSSQNSCHTSTMKLQILYLIKVSY